MGKSTNGAAELQFAVFTTHLGFMGIVATVLGVRRTYLPVRSEAATRRQIRDDFPTATENARLMPGLVKKLQRYATGAAVQFDETLDWSWARDFEAAVWKACHRIGFGSTMSYGELAEPIGCPGAARAVGSALGKNPFPILVPCHRVLKSDGTIGGWSGPGGLEQKRSLLDLEAAALAVR